MFIEKMLDPLIDGIFPNTPIYPEFIVYRDKDALVVKILLGVSPDKFNVEVIENRLIIKGERDFIPDDKEIIVSNLFSSSKEFERAIYFTPDKYDIDKIVATYKDGVLTLTVPTIKPKHKKITIKE